MPQSAKKTRERQLAKLAARRAAERRRKRRQRIVATAVGLFLVVGLISGEGQSLGETQRHPYPDSRGQPRIVGGVRRLGPPGGVRRQADL
jgi:hypothetical protein